MSITVKKITVQINSITVRTSVRLKECECSKDTQGSLFERGKN